MNISDMIDIMRTLGIGEVYNDDTSQEIALRFLNLANDELYRETANINPNILTIDIIESFENESFFVLNSIPFSISKVYRIGSTVPLRGLSILEFNTYTIENPNPGDPAVYCVKGDVVSFWPFSPDVTYTFNTSYPVERTLLDITTIEADIPYPISYQSVLVDGGLYYLFQDEGGFKNPIKENEALRRWQKGKTDLKSYFYGSNKQFITTFSSA